MTGPGEAVRPPADVGVLERGRARVRAERSALLRELTALVAHEISQPLASIAASGMAALHWLDRPVPDVGEAVRSLKRVVEHKDRAAEKISHIRGAISALAPLAPQTVALRDVVEGAIAGVAEEMAAATVRLEVGGVPDLARLPLSRVELELVFIQLFRNAIEAMVSVKSRTLTVRCQAEGARWLAEVEDTGPGIDEDQAARLFDLFFTTKAAADGVGLSIGRSIVARAGGKLMLASTGPGGSTFRIELPFALADGV